MLLIFVFGTKHELFWSRKIIQPYFTLKFKWFLSQHHYPEFNKKPIQLQHNILQKYELGLFTANNHTRATLCQHHISAPPTIVQSMQRARQRYPASCIRRVPVADQHSINGGAQHHSLCATSVFTIYMQSSASLSRPHCSTTPAEIDWQLARSQYFCYVRIASCWFYLHPSNEVWIVWRAVILVLIKSILPWWAVCTRRKNNVMQLLHGARIFSAAGRTGGREPADWGS